MDKTFRNHKTWVHNNKANYYPCVWYNVSQIEHKNARLIYEKYINDIQEITINLNCAEKLRVRIYNRRMVETLKCIYIIFPKMIARIIHLYRIHFDFFFNPLTPRRTQVSPYTEISILF